MFLAFALESCGFKMILRNFSFIPLHFKSGSDKKKDASFSFSVIVVDLRCEKICAQSRF